MISTTLYLGATSSSTKTQTSSLSTFTHDKIQTQLINMISKQKSSRSYNTWTLFDTHGHILRKFSMSQTPKQPFFSKNPTSYMMLLVEGGTWFWPGVHIGFQRTIRLSNNQAITLETLSIQPLLLSVNGFLSIDECEYIQQRAKPYVTKSSDVTLQDQDHGKPASNWRTSQSTFISSHNDHKLIKLEQRTADLTRIPKHHQEDLQVLKYTLNQHYDSHTDYFDLSLYQKDESIKRLTKNGMQNRFVTVFWYLSNVEKGGETIFPRFNNQPPLKSNSDCTKGLKVKPEMGKVIVFYSLLPNGLYDPLSLHAACPVEQGIKWAANKWIWNAPMPFVSP